MANLTLSIPEEVKRKMEKFKEINWSEIARAAIKKRVILLEEMNELLKHSELTEEDTIKLGKTINKKVAKKLLKK